MQVLLEGRKVRERQLAKCQNCESILEEQVFRIDYLMTCPICSCEVKITDWYAKGSAEYEDLEREVQINSI